MGLTNKKKNNMNHGSKTSNPSLQFYKQRNVNNINGSQKKKQDEEETNKMKETKTTTKTTNEVTKKLSVLSNTTKSSATATVSNEKFEQVTDHSNANRNNVVKRNKVSTSPPPMQKQKQQQQKHQQPKHQQQKQQKKSQGTPQTIPKEMDKKKLHKQNVSPINSSPSSSQQDRKMTVSSNESKKKIIGKELLRQDANMRNPNSANNRRDDSKESCSEDSEQSENCAHNTTHNRNKLFVESNKADKVSEERNEDSGNDDDDDDDESYSENEDDDDGSENEDDEEGDDNEDDEEGDDNEDDKHDSDNENDTNDDNTDDSDSMNDDDKDIDSGEDDNGVNQPIISNKQKDSKFKKDNDRKSSTPITLSKIPGSRNSKKEVEVDRAKEESDDEGEDEKDEFDEEEEDEGGNHDDHDDEDDEEDDEESNDKDEEQSTSEEEESHNSKGNKKINKAFTDENASWLKPKKATKAELLSSSDEDGEDGNDDDEDDDEADDNDDNDDDDDDELLEIEKESRVMDAEMEAEKEEAEEEMRRTIAEHTSVYHLPTNEEVERDADRVVPPSEIRSHIESILEVLAEFQTRREPGRSRKEYTDRLSAYLSELHGYLPELVDYFMTMFSPAEAVEFVAASDRPRPLVIRTNTLKARRKDLAAALIRRGVTLDPLASWSKVGIKIVESPVPIGATPEYLSGMYMLQSAASMCPVVALGPEPNERVLDVSAAPGGKTSYIAQLMRNTGVILANDLKPERQKATVANLHRLGVKNVITCCYDGRVLGKEFRTNRFDKVLLDAPCSGLGVISRDPSVKVQRTIADVQKCAQLQKELILQAIDALKCYNNNSSRGSGIMVYSTCSISVYENEEVIQYALRKRDIQLMNTGLDFGTPGFTRYQTKRFHPSMTLTRRFYPHTVNMDGFFVCKIKKLSDTIPNTMDNDKEDTHPKTNDESADVEMVTKVTTNKDVIHKTTKQTTKMVYTKNGLRKKLKNKLSEQLTKKRKEVADGTNETVHPNDETNSSLLPTKKRRKEMNRSIPPISATANKRSFPEKNSENSNAEKHLHKKQSKTNAKVTKPRRRPKMTNP